MGSMSEVRSELSAPTSIERLVALGDEVTVYAGVHLRDDISVYPRLKLPAGIARAAAHRGDRAGGRAAIPVMRFGLALPHYDFSCRRRSGRSRSGERPRSRCGRRRSGSTRCGCPTTSCTRSRGTASPSRCTDRSSRSPRSPASQRSRERVRLGTLVLGAPFRHPSLLAKTVAALDSISDGRHRPRRRRRLARGRVHGVRLPLRHGGGALRRAGGDAPGAGGAAGRVRGLGHVRVGRAEVGAPAAAARAAAAPAGMGRAARGVHGCCGSPRATRTGGTWCGA